MIDVDKMKATAARAISLLKTAWSEHAGGKGLTAKWDAIWAAGNARDEAFLAMLDTPPPDVAVFAEKIGLTADGMGWADDPRVQQVATLARDARRLCDGH